MKSENIKRKKLISVGLIFGLLLTQTVGLSGCGEQQQEEQITLVEPEGNVSGTEPVRRRTIYNAEVYEAQVDPHVEEYSYEQSKTFLSTDVHIGDTVKAGDVLYRTDWEPDTKRIERLEEKCEALKKSFEEYQKDIEETIYTQQLTLKKWEEELEDHYVTEPEPGTKEYGVWQNEEKVFKGQYNKAELDLRMSEEALRQRRELYELDYNYYLLQINEIRKLNDDGVIRSTIDGQVVSLLAADEGQYIYKGRTVAAVADMNFKMFICDGLEKSKIVTIKDSYAFFDGKRYQADYYEEGSYYGKAANGTPVNQSAFILRDPDNEVPVGSYGRFVIFTRLREQALVVPNGALHINGKDRYVSVLENGKTVSKTVKTGITDGFYTEILSGVEEGEILVIDRSDPVAVNTYELKEGEVFMNYSATGLAVSLDYESIGSGVENGKIYFDEWVQTVTNTRVEAGTLIAKIHVVGDEQKLAEMETELKREKERLADLIADDLKNDSSANKETIKSRQEKVDELEEQVAKLKKDYNTTEVRTDKAGLLYSLSRWSYDQETKTSREIKPGDLIEWDTFAWISQEKYGYIYLQDNPAYGKLGYNTVLTLNYPSGNGEKYEDAYAEVTVINIDGKQAVLLDEEILKDWWYSPADGKNPAIRKNPSLTGKIKEVKNVVMLPTQAIKTSSLKNNFCYVNVLQDDGTICPTPVLVGGKYIDEKLKTYYWVVEGLSEGMTVCWE